MDPCEKQAMEIEDDKLSAGITISVDLANLEINQRKLQAELKMKRNQVEHLRDQEDAQNMKVYELKKNLDASKARISELQFELAITKNTCAAYNMQLKSTPTAQLKMQHEKLLIENKALKELLQNSETERRTLTRKFEDLNSLYELETANKKGLAEQQSKIKVIAEKIFRSFKEIEKDSTKIKAIHEKLQQVKAFHQYVDVYKQLSKDAIAKRNEMEEQYLIVKAKLDVLTNLLKNYPLSQFASAANVQDYKQRIEKLQKELDDERELTIRQNKRLTTEIAQNVTLSLQVDNLERDIMGSTKCMKDICVQTEN